jgi:hypothetical protein
VQTGTLSKNRVDKLVNLIGSFSSRPVTVRRRAKRHIGVLCTLLIRCIVLHPNFRRAGHKKECGESPAKHLTLKLAERALAVPKISEYIQMHSILTLGLLGDRTNAEHYVVNVKCRTQPADLMAYMARMMSRQEKDANAQVLLNVAAFERIALEDAPEQTRKKAANARELLKLGIWSDEQPAGEDSILVSFFLTSVFEDDDGKFQVDGGQDGSISATCLLPEHAMRFMANNPKSILRSATFGDSEVDLNESNLRE